jgi:hypothetical protein
MAARKEPTSTVSIRVSLNEKKILEAIAYQDRDSVSGVLGRLIEQLIGMQEPKGLARVLHEMNLKQPEPQHTLGIGPVDAIMKEVEKLQQQSADRDTKVKKK